MGRVAAAPNLSEFPGLARSARLDRAAGGPDGTAAKYAEETMKWLEYRERGNFIRITEAGKDLFG